MDQGQVVQVAPSDAELQRAIASVPGVVSADIDRSAATGQSRMRLRLAPGEDEEAVAWSVAATLRERFGIALDPDAIRPRPAGSVAPEGDPVRLVQNGVGDIDGGFDGDGDGDGATSEGATVAGDAQVEGPRSDGPSADVGLNDLNDLDDLDGVADVVDLADLLDEAHPPATNPLADGSVGADASASQPEVDSDLRSNVIPRAAIRDLRVQRDERSVRVTVVLGHGDRAEEGRATSVPTSHGTLRAVAEATVDSLRGFAEGPLLVGIDRVSANHGEHEPVATVVVSLVTHRGEERLLGASIMYDSPERAVLRATLDALNRRVMPLLLDRDA